MAFWFREFLAANPIGVSPAGLDLDNLRTYVLKKRR
jgi:hypothetical protein